MKSAKLNNIITSILSVFILLSIFVTGVRAEKNPVRLYLFYGDGCPHCEKEREFLKELKSEYKDEVSIYEYEIYYDMDNVELLTEISELFGIEIQGVPILFISDSDKAITGFGGSESTGQTIHKYIEECLSLGCSNSLEPLFLKKERLEQSYEVSTPVETERNELEDKSTEAEEKKENGEEDLLTLKIPILGEVNLKSLSLPLATILIAFMDGFNPCAMWILIFLITMLINIEDKRKLYSLGTIFIVTSALVYFIFLAAWFNFFKFIGYAYWIKVIIGIVAVICGISHLRSALFSRGECHAVSNTKRKSIMNRIKSIVKERQYYLAVLGIITLAVSVNLIEVVCSAGLPSIYTSLLATAKLSTISYYAYLILYTFIFMLDDLTIFFIAIRSFEVTGITGKYTKYSSLIGGFLILIIGVLLIFKPDLLMFG
jgi:thiol-disulfide isomerase/thioredoxin